MAKRGKIEKAGVENDVLEMARQGLGSRAIAKELTKSGLKISHTAVNRFLSDEADDRERARRVTVAKKAAEVAGKASEDVDDNLARLRSMIGPLVQMGTKGTRLVSFPEGGTRILSLRDEQALKKHPGISEWFEKVSAKTQVEAAEQAQKLLAYLVELAGANPRAANPKDLEAIRSAIAEVFGYGAAPEKASPQEAPPTEDEHQPPVLH